MAIRLTPIGAQILLGTPMDLLTDRTLALEDIDSRFSQLLTGHAETTQHWAARFDIVETIIAARLASAHPAPAGLVHSWRSLQESPTDVDLARLPEQFGCSRRHLIAQFHMYFGMAPKTIARISRFHLAVAAIHRAGQRDRLLCEKGENRISIVRPPALFPPASKRRYGGQIWRSTAATTTSPISSTSSGLFLD